MTADSPRDYSPEAEGVRDCCANLAMTFREFLRGDWTPHAADWREWADRLERAVQRMDQEQMEPLAPPEVPRGPWRLEPDGDAGFDVVMTRKNGRQTTIRLPWAGNDRYAVALRDAFNRVERDRPLEDEKASQRPYE